MALNYNVKGSVSYTIVGTPTIVDGVVSNSTYNDYIRLNTVFDGTANYEFQYKFKLSDDLSGSRSLQIPSSGAFNEIDITSDRFTCYLGRDTDNTRWVGFTCSYDFLANTDYTIRINKTGNVFKGYIAVGSGDFTLLNEQTITDLVPSTSVTLCPTRQESGKTFPGSIDLNNTYIKVNGQAWFGACPVEVKHIDYGTSVGYTKVGSPTISNGVVSGFSSGNYLTIPAYSSNINSIVFNTKIASYSTTAGNVQIIYRATNSNPIIRITGSTLQVVYQYANILTADISSYTSSLYVRVELYANTQYLYISANGIDWNLANTSSVSIDFSGITADGSIGINGYNQTQVFDGSIDLNKTYIKVNGSLWFYKPCTNYLVKDSKLIWADSGLYIEENGVKTYATQNLAPVPSGYTYGSTTTTDVGIIDMTTQVFTAHSGATLGKDE